MGHRCTAALIVVGLLALASAGCKSADLPFHKTSRDLAAPPTVQKVDAKVHPGIHSEFGAFEVAVMRPTSSGVGAEAMEAFRTGLYDTLLDRGYSPLALAYVDERGERVAVPGRTYPLRAHITEVMPARDGGHVASGWAGLVAMREDGTEETLYLCEITELAIPPGKGSPGRDGGADTGRLLAEALLRGLPAR